MAFEILEVFKKMGRIHKPSILYKIIKRVEGVEGGCSLYHTPPLLDPPLVPGRCPNTCGSVTCRRGLRDHVGGATYVLCTSKAQAMLGCPTQDTEDLGPGAGACSDVCPRYAVPVTLY